MKKKKTVGKLKKELWTVFSKYTRLRDSIRTTNTCDKCKCITCGTLCDTVNMDAGHGISRKYNSTFVDERNVKAQCKKCNGFGAGEQYLFSKSVDEIHGEGTFEALEQLKHTTKKFYTYELEELIEHYKTELNKLIEKHGSPWK